MELTINLRGLPPRYALRAAKLVADTVDRLAALPVGERAKNEAMAKVPTIVRRQRQRAGVR